jgi:hypothetical protein
LATDDDAFVVPCKRKLLSSKRGCCCLDPCNQWVNDSGPRAKRLDADVVDVHGKTQRAVLPHKAVQEAKHEAFE